jgi:rhamnose utilization protein RhaD (predicted bifunctional aldolase and dehydrogenase)
MPQKFVAHLHCVNSISQLIQLDWSNRVHLALPSANDYLLVDYYKPGEELAENVLLEIQKNGPKKIIFLRNHGVIYGADSIEELMKLINETSAAFELNIKDILQNRIKEISTENEDFNHPQLTNLKHPAFDAVKSIEMFWEYLEKIWEIVPDHVVFLHKPERSGLIPYEKLATDLDFIFHDKNCLIKKNISLVKLEQLIFYFNVIARVEDFSNINVLNQQQILSIKDWDAEKYRSINQN